MKIAVIMFLVLVSIGCNRAASIILPDGSNGFAVSCKNNMQKCYQIAGKKCPFGYDLVDNDKTQSSSAGAGMANGQAYYASDSRTNITMIIRCKQSKITEPVKNTP